MNEYVLQSVVKAMFDQAEAFDLLTDDVDDVADLIVGADVRTFEDAGILTNNKGLVVRLPDGSEFQLTIVRSR